MGERDRPTILVVDDDPGIRDALHLVLDDDYDVIDVENGSQALATLASRTIHLILLDLVMEGIDGFALLEQRRPEDRAVPIIVLSGLDTAGTAATAMRLGAVDYVTKPFDEAALQALVRDTLAAPTGRHVLDGAPISSWPVVLLVGVDLGVHASVSVLLRQRCRIVRVETVDGALLSSGSVPPSVLVVDLPGLRRQGAEAITRLRAHFADAKFIIIAAGFRPGATPSPCTVLEPPTHVANLSEAIRGRLAANSIGHHYSDCVASVLDQLGTHYAAPPLRRLSRVLGVSVDHLSTLFRDETGLTLKVYMNAVRVEAAKWLLLEARENIETVAARIGLHDGSHLSKLFLRYAGTRPGAYRRAGRQGAIGDRE